jgi:hypothetical protein
VMPKRRPTRAAAKKKMAPRRRNARRMSY